MDSDGADEPGSGVAFSDDGFHEGDGGGEVGGEQGAQIPALGRDSVGREPGVGYVHVDGEGKHEASSSDGDESGEERAFFFGPGQVE